MSIRGRDRRISGVEVELRLSLGIRSVLRHARAMQDCLPTTAEHSASPPLAQRLAEGMHRPAKDDSSDHEEGGTTCIW